MGHPSHPSTPELLFQGSGSACYHRDYHEKDLEKLYHHQLTKWSTFSEQMRHTSGAAAAIHHTVLMTLTGKPHIPYKKHSEHLERNWSVKSNFFLLINNGYVYYGHEKYLYRIGSQTSSKIIPCHHSHHHSSCIWVKYLSLNLNSI